LERAIQSALAQTAGPLEIIVVDDGSTDDSLAVARVWAGRDARVKVIAKSNGGQLSAFNVGFQNATGDILCFLDADDEFQPGYLARLAGIYREKPQVDFIFCRCNIVGETIASLPWEMPGESFDLGLTLCRTYLLRQWLGAATSCLSARRRLLSRFLPCPLEADWRRGADNVVVFGISLFLGRKYYLAEKLVNYHRHRNNDWVSGPQDPAAAMDYQIRVTRLIHHFTNGADWTRVGGDDCGPMIFEEFKTIPQPRWSELRIYLCLIRGFARRGKLKQCLRLWRHWRKTRRVFGLGTGRASDKVDA
jgi:pentatricopeptide repeat protein